MEKYFKAIFDLTKLPTKFFFLLSAVSGFFLFVDQEFINEKLFLDIAKDRYGWVLGIIFVLCTGLVLVNLVLWIFRSIQRKILIQKWKKKFIQHIKTLDRFEKSIIREFFINGQKSIDMPIDDSSVAGLLDKNILVMNRPFNNSSIMNGMETSLCINETVLEILEFKDINMNDKPSEEELIFVKQNRPEWTSRW